MKKLSAIVAVISILAFGCCAQNLHSQVPAKSVPPEVTELFNYVMENGDKVADCKVGKDCRKMRLTKNSVKDGVVFAGVLDVNVEQGRVIKSNKTMTFTVAMAIEDQAYGGTWSQEAVFTDKCADGKLEYVKYTMIQDEELLVNIELKNGKLTIGGLWMQYLQKPVTVAEIENLYQKEAEAVLKVLKAMKAQK